MNKVILTGRLTADPELRQTQSGISSCTFTVAVNRRFKDKETGKTEADFIRCVAWRQTAEFVSRYFSKGQMIAIEGSIRTGSYKDKTYPDITHYTTDVYVDNAEFCGSKGESSGGGHSYAPTPAPTPAQSAVQSAQAQGIDAISIGEFEDILADGSVPF